MQRKHKILVVGGGGREHALAWRCATEGHEVLAAPGSDAIATVARRFDIGVRDHEELVRLAVREGVDLVLIGPEQPLVEGLADRCRLAGLATFGPSAAAAELEGSKAAAKAFMARHHIPTAAYRTVGTLDEGLVALQAFERPPVIKASGLAAGKGVVVCGSFAEAETALRECLADHRFGAAGDTVVVEERLEGEEVSFFVVTDGRAAVTFPPVQDHKRLGDGDTGPNTGGMGAYLPAPVCSPQVHARIMEKIVEPTLSGLRLEGRPFCGVLFVGLMVDASGEPFVIEYNVRFGDPEAQALLLGLDEPLVPHLIAAANGGLTPGSLRAHASAVVVLASAGYPASSTTGVPIEGLGEAQTGRDDVVVFHAGTRRENATWLTAGGRVLGVAAKAQSIQIALSRAYEGLAGLTLDGGQWRRDVGAQALQRLGESPINLHTSGQK
ncbi:MAG: phosphoribosylamine--glycine ligase [Myxococcales bacterium FL481]|nr:MAG: phosphoribosylamine--glycine ligase [Myxococcales bacterium FL481]